MMSAQMLASAGSVSGTVSDLAPGAKDGMRMSGGWRKMARGWREDSWRIVGGWPKDGHRMAGNWLEDG